MSQIITDKYGEEYPVSIAADDGFFEALVYRNGLVGLIRCQLRSHDEMVIGDLYICDATPVKERWWQTILRILLRLKPRVINYRQRGLGTALLKFTLNYAQTRGFKCVTGFIQSQDVSVEDLISWYRENGFVVDTNVSPPTLFFSFEKIEL